MIDTLESFEAAEEVKAAFKEKVPNKPIVAIILVRKFPKNDSSKWFSVTKTRMNDATKWSSVT